MAKRKCYFNNELKAEFPFLSCSDTDNSTVFCNVCSSTISVAHGGRSDITDHIDTKKHKVGLNARASSSTLTKYFTAKEPGKDEYSLVAAEGGGGVRKVQPRIRGTRIPPQNPQLFDDTSMQQNTYGYTQPGTNYNMSDNTQSSFYAQPLDSQQQYTDQSQMNNMAFPGQQLFNDPMASMAVQYGQTLAGQGTEFVNKNIEKYVSSSKLKYYFAVDSAYVGKKLGLILFPFAHSDWSLRLSQDGPVAPRYDVNAPDLYIPVMAFVTYTLLAGLILGTQNRFTPEQLGITASTALVWTIIELLVLFITMYVLAVSTGLKYLDLLSYCGYKYVGMIVILLSSMAFHSAGYYASLAWMSLTIIFFLVRSLRLAIQPHSDPETFERGNKRRLYMLLVIAAAQPLLMWWLTRRLVVFE